MILRESGLEHKETALLLHGGGLSWWNYKHVMELLQTDYHVILPILDGHAESDRDFISIRSNAEEVISFIDKTCKGHIKLLCGLSLGAQILTEILSLRPDICDFAVIESALVIPMKITHALIEPSVSMSYSLICKEWFAAIQFKSLKIDAFFYEDYYRDTCRISKKNMIAFLKANSAYRINPSISQTTAKVCIMVGQKEGKKMRRSAKYLQELIPDSTMIIFDGWYHGEASINHAEEYVNTIRAFMEDELGNSKKNFL